MNAISAGFCADVKHGITHASRFTEKDLIVPHDAECERIDERVQSIRIIKRDFTTDSRHTKRISVMRNACDDARQQRSIAASVLRVVQRSETQTVHRGNWTRTHRKNVAKNAADACRCTLKRFDE